MKLFKSTLNAILISSLFVFAFTSCEDDDEDLMGNWIKLGSFEGLPRTGAVSFVIGDYGYVGMGYNKDLDEDERQRNDFWKYDAANDYWTQVADYDGNARYFAVAFVANEKAYVTTGYDGTNRYKETYEYDPSTDTWTEKTPFIGSARYDAVAFGIGNYGYVGTGYDGNNLKDFYRYDAVNDSWESIYSIGGEKRRGASVFVLDDKAYVFNGTNNGSYVDGVYMYDPEDGSWTAKRSIASDGTDDSYDDDYEIVSAYNATFTISGFGYVTTGYAGSVSNSTWEYDPVNDLWEELSNFEGSSRRNAVGFTINNTPYVVGGYNGSDYLDDVWTFDPNAEQDDDD